MFIKNRTIWGFLIVAILGFGMGFGFWRFTVAKVRPDAIRVSGAIARITPEELAASSPLIIEGTVSSILPAQWNTSDGKEPNTISEGDIIYHDVLIDVNEILKGSLTEKPLRVRVYEGNVPDGKTIKARQSEGEPKFSLHERVLLFLTYDDSPYNKSRVRNYYITRGMFQGKFTISDGQASNTMDSFNLEVLRKIIEEHKNDPPKTHKSRPISPET
ncbi:hypothetical protein SAMN00808754_1323 [Thermanaeromonas toyohensis ToBE]|uniref:Uncharacterized protein n=1 Tax=Thermanaeromonas toyohensis ToBE TaxID=698762 RepID=A0A1W1VR20_9FIRM|nr:hypothetical protein [Thermanaeromonas toyohensis]SMB95799.1 hypothetical protein SAMN00808754_1323 [Thermanaeromonas toyohensis ToBE]